MNATPPPGAPPPVPQPAPRKGLSKGCIIAIVVTIFVVIGGVVVLAVLGVVGGRFVLEKAKALQAKATMASLEIAVKGYKTEYEHLPYAGIAAPAQDNQPWDSNDANGVGLLKVLSGTDAIANPRHVRFWQAPPPMPGGGGYTEEKGLADPWGQKGYRIILDYDNDGRIADPEGASGSIKESVLIYSAGPDGDFSTWNDNVCSWK